MEATFKSVLRNIEELYLEIFDFENIQQRQKARNFRCVNKKHCMVDDKYEPIYSLYIGDEGSDILIVGEAPSAVEGEIGGMVNGIFSNTPINNKSPIHKLRDFVKENFGGKTPYFTDLIKCGSEKQINKNAGNKLILREGHCFEHLLRREIEIIKPRYIFCVGDTSYNMLDGMANKINFDRKNIKHLTHYAHNAGKIKEFNTGINIEDKINYVWPWETGLITYKKALKIEREKIRIPSKKVKIITKKNSNVNKVMLGKKEFLISFWQSLLDSAKSRTNLHVNVKPSERSYVIARVKRYLEFNYQVLNKEARVDLYINSGDKTKNKSIYDSLFSRKDQIQKVFGDELTWERLDGKYACRISKSLNVGSYKNRDRWPEIQKSMINAMVQFEAALMPCIESLSI